MIKHCLPFSALIFGFSVLAFAETGTPAPPAKVGIIHIQDAIVRTQDGQKALADLRAKFTPKKAELDQKQSAIAQLQDQLRKGENTMSDDAKQKLMLEIDRKTKEVNRETEDAQADLEQQQRQMMQEIGERVMALVTKYSKDNGFALIVDVSSQQSPVLYAAPDIDITSDVIELYDKKPAAPMTTAAPANNAAVASAAPVSKK